MANYVLTAKDFMRHLIFSLVFILPVTSLFGQSPRIAVMETAFKTFADAKSFKLASQAGYTAMQMHSGNLDVPKKKPIPSSAGLPLGDDPEILKSWQAASKRYAQG